MTNNKQKEKLDINMEDEVEFVKKEQIQFSTIEGSVVLKDFIGRKKHFPSLLSFHKYHKSISINRI